MKHPLQNFAEGMKGLTRDKLAEITVTGEMKKRKL